MEQLIILQGITVEQLLTRIEAVIEKKITEKIQEAQTVKPFRYMTRKEVADYLHVSLPTLHEWAKMERIKSYRIGSRILFRSDEVEESVKIRRFRR